MGSALAVCRVKPTSVGLAQGARQGRRQWLVRAAWGLAGNSRRSQVKLAEHKAMPALMPTCAV